MSGEEPRLIPLNDLVPGTWVWMPLAVWKQERTRWGGLTCFTPGPGNPPPPDKAVWLHGYGVVTWRHWPEAQHFSPGERIEVEMQYTPITRSDGSLWHHTFYRRDFDLNIKLRDSMRTWKAPCLLLSERSTEGQGDQS